MRYYTNHLEHHGILGQKWGIRRFQNYNGRLTSAGKARVQERNKSSDEEGKKGLTDGQKKALVTGAIVVASCLAVYGGYKLATSPQGREPTDKLINRNKDTRISEISSGDNGGSADIIGSVGKSFSDIDQKMVSSINEDGWVGNPPRLTTDCARNCSQTSIAYIMNSVLGMNVKAKGFGGVDEISGLVQKGGRNKNVFGAIFDGIQATEVPASDREVDKAINHIKNGTTGIIRIQQGEFGHFLNYERDNNGNLVFIDCQSGKVGRFEDLGNKSNFILTDIFDCSNATLREDSDNYLKYMVK